MNIDNLKATKEYSAETADTGSERFKFIVNKVSKDSKGTVIKITVTCLDHFRKTIEYDAKDFNFVNIIEPVNSTEFFMMYTNFNNFFNKGVNQDLNYAKKIADSILNTLKIRGYVREGSGKFESYDYRLVDKFIELKKALI